MKPGWDNESKIREQLQKNNPFKLKLYFPVQGKKIIYMFMIYDNRNFGKAGVLN